MKLATTTLLACAIALAGVMGAANAAAPMLADRHVAKGVVCAVCHGPDMSKPAEPATSTCTGCHNVDALVEKTKGVKPTNPHVSPHYAKDLDCINCHLGHQPSENFCNQCHQFQFKVP